MTLRHFCTNCGATLQPDVRFCKNCGQAGEGNTSAPSASHPSTPAPIQTQRKFPWRILFVAGGCLGLLCIAAVGIGGYAYFQNLIPGGEPVAPAPFVTEVFVTQTSLPSAPIPAPSTTPEPSDSGLSLTGDQRVDDHSLYDDFSSESLQWPVFDDDKTIIQYENGAYSFQIAETDYYDWAYFPVDFIPYEIEFDVRGPEGSQDGTFGVFCHLQDADNYYYVEFDLHDNSYVIAQYVDAEYIPLTEENSSDQFWHTAEALNSPPSAVNHIGLSCYLDSITLFANGQFVDDVSVQQPFDQPGEAAFFVYAFDFAGPEGYKVFFDNVETWQPVQ